MAPISLRGLLLTIAVTIAVAYPTPAQPTQGITRDPHARQVHPIWRLVDHEEDFNYNGPGVGHVPVDINADGYDDVAIYSRTAEEWRFYLGGPDSIGSEPAIRLPIPLSHQQDLVVGKFWGDERQAVAVGYRGTDSTLPASEAEQELFSTWQFHMIEHGTLDTAPRHRLLTRIVPEPPISTLRSSILPREAVAADLDNDGADELILYGFITSKYGRSSSWPEIWIYRGGPAFPMEWPTVVLRGIDPVFALVELSLVVGHWDNDGRKDIALTTFMPDGRTRLYFWFSSPTSPWSWSTPHRNIPIDNRYNAALDCDGDGQLDLALPPAVGMDFQCRLYLSGSGKNIRTRSFDTSDFDRLFVGRRYFRPVRLGYFNDRDRKYEMLGLVGYGPLLGFDGGVNGPDLIYEIEAMEAIHNTYEVYPIGDANGDGWDDVLAVRYAESVTIDDRDTILVFAGGPYIRDDRSSGMNTTSDRSRCYVVDVWPNPASDNLHIALRGGDDTSAAEYRVYDLLGQEIASGAMQADGGIWHCSGIPPGVYLLVIADRADRRIATVPITKE